MLERVFISKREDSYGGHISLFGEMDCVDITVGEWLADVLGGESIENSVVVRN